MRNLLLAALLLTATAGSAQHYHTHELDLRPYPELPRFTRKQLQDARQQRDYELIDMWEDERHNERVDRMEREYYDYLLPDPGEY